MNVEEILTQYQNGNLDEPFFLLSDGRTVVGEKVDENNHLFYVIKDDQGAYAIEDAQGKEIVRFLKELRFSPTQTRTTSTNSSET